MDNKDYVLYASVIINIALAFRTFYMDRLRLSITANPEKDGDATIIRSDGKAEKLRADVWKIEIENNSEKKVIVKSLEMVRYTRIVSDIPIYFRYSEAEKIYTGDEKIEIQANDFAEKKIPSEKIIPSNRYAFRVIAILLNGRKFRSRLIKGPMSTEPLLAC